MQLHRILILEADGSFCVRFRVHGRRRSVRASCCGGRLGGQAIRHLAAYGAWLLPPLSPAELSPALSSEREASNRSLTAASIMERVTSSRSSAAIETDETPTVWGHALVQPDPKQLQGTLSVQAPSSHQS